MHHKRLSALILLICLPVALSMADSEVEMQEVVVTATRTAEESLTAPGHITVLD